MSDPLTAAAISNGKFRIDVKKDYLLIVGLSDIIEVSAPSGDYDITELVSEITDPVIIGYCSTDDYMVVFTTSASNISATPTSTSGQIWKFQYNVATDTINSSYMNGIYLKPSTSLVYNNLLDFSLYNKINAVQYKRDSSNIKVYFWDKYNNLRHINIADSDAATLEVNELDLISNVSLTKPILSNVTGGGSLQSGVIQYAYQLYDQGSNTTYYSPVSNLVHLTGGDFKGGNENDAKSSNYYGQTRGNSSGKAVTMSVSDIDSAYSWIKIVSIHFSAAGETPVINIIKDAPFSGTSLLFTDSGGTTLGSLTLQEFRGMGGLLLSPKAAEVKDNILFIGNTEEDRFEVTDEEFDARVYRWNAGGSHFKYKDVAGNEYSTSDYTTVSATADAIQDRTYQETDYKYAAGGTGRLGGTGPNISYVFKLIQLKGDAQTEHGNNRILYSNQYPKAWTADGFETDNTSFGNYASPYHSSQFRGYMRDEIYRIGIVFYDKRGRQSYVKWISDIKMPAVYETDSETTYNADITGGTLPKIDFSISFTDNNVVGKDIYLNILYPEFTVTIPAALAQRISGYEVVRVKREEQDKSISCQGLLGWCKRIPTPDYDPVYRTVPKGISLNGYNSYDASRDILTFMSPEINFRKSLQFSAGDYFKHISTSYDSETTVINPGDLELVTKVSGMKFPGNVGAVYNLTDGIISGVSNAFMSVGSYNDFTNYFQYEDAGGLHTEGYGGTKFVMTLPSGTFIDITALSLYEVMYINYYKNLVNQYGGNTYSDRSNNTYISTGSYISVESDVTVANSISVLGGDIFLDIYDYLAQIMDRWAEFYWQWVLFFPVETTINLPLRLDSCFHRMATSGGTASYLSETVSHMEEMWDLPNLYANRTDLYIENTAYSKDNDSRVYVPKPLNYDPVLSNPHRIHYSLQKGQDDIEDRWLSFLPDNYKDVDASFGDVTNLTVLNDILLFTQERAFGALGVNERALMTTDKTASTLVLGTGGVLDEYRYLSTNHGTIQRPVIGDNGIYFYDSVNNKVILYSGQEAPLSDVKGISSYLRDNTYVNLQEVDTPLLGTGISGVHDSANNRILFTFLGGATDFTISYNELLQAFESFHSFTPDLYMSHKGRTFSLYNSKNIYVHNKGDYNTFYGAYQDSSVTLLLSPVPEINKVFTNMEFDTLVANATTGVEITPRQTVKSIRVWNEYQDSGTINLTSGTNVVDRLRKWRLQIPRSVSGTTGRIRDKYVFVTLTLTQDPTIPFIPQADHRVVLYDVITWYMKNIQ
ncbi:hypothetical protein KKF82_06115 [Patescibacteria group bacterium]|nr:hypothetical protein [Patescibacteria group bacterium]